ncbi:MAG: sigma factor-like helix-turn-helix DNA-binding protein [Dehalococcoidia bacterium]
MEKSVLTPEQRLWRAVFPRRDIIPRLDGGRVRQILDTLSERERKVLRLRFGFEGGPWSLRDVARVLPRAEGGVGVKRERVWQMEKEALKALRRPRLRKAWREAETRE